MSAPERRMLETSDLYLPLGAVPEPAQRGDIVWTRRGPAQYLGPDARSDTGSTTYWVELLDGNGGGMFSASSIQAINAAGDGPSEGGDAWRGGQQHIPFPRQR